MTKKRWAVGVDIGGTKLAVGAVSSYGKVLHEQFFPTHRHSLPEEILVNISQAAIDFQKKVGSTPIGIGVGIPGQMDSHKGIVYSCPNLEKWKNVPLQTDLQHIFDLPVFITNDVRAATWGEWLFGAGKGCNDLVCLYIGTGVGGGIINQGRILEGSSNTAGELGHMIISFNGPKCTCGNNGCLEAFAGGWAIAKTAQETINSNSELGTGILKLVDGKIEAITAREVIQAFNQKDPLAIQIIENVREALIAGVVSIVHTLNPQRIIIGGGISHGLPQLVEWIAEGVYKNALKAATPDLKILPAKLGVQSGVIGAAGHLLI